tara:strand:+ start:612 stop:917 length:306 start_codon:yes stop_codon:yes gene_type:complete
MRESLIKMLHQLLSELDYVQSQGAGYYTCTPFAQRFNKLVVQAANYLGEDNSLVQSFDALDETDPKDPADKSKRLLGVRIEIGQLIALLESSAPETSETGN